MTVLQNAMLLGGHVFFNRPESFWNSIKMFHEDRTINLASRQNKENAPPPRGHQYVPHYSVGGHKNALPPGGHVFQPTGTIFELFHDNRTINVASKVLTSTRGPERPKEMTCNMQPKNIIRTKLLTKLNSPSRLAMFFLQTRTIFKFIQDIIITRAMQLLTKFGVYSVGGVLPSDKHLVDGPTDRPT
ncbi:hypothetical protein DPMN_079971 [Dreissena polymorpha]|uniref:Uncharacterized protein n=1 Tax=Dreissena polymorpha TaxID=45954 RepID=A0A9D4BIT8_DREPO|nr:hypothetical protein DPMN_079971 [Dreissena polymorpha]